MRGISLDDKTAAIGGECHVMVDIETLGTAPGSVVASIGAVAFNPKAGVLLHEFEVSVSVADAQTCGLTIDASTVLWWMEQETAARTSTFGGRSPLKDALSSLSRFIEGERALSGDGAVRVWAHSPLFDVVMLDAAFKATNGVPPWNFREPRDTRTLFDLAGVDPRSFAKDEIAHNALADARVQARAVIEAYRIIGLGA